MAELYRKARDADARSSFGSVVVFNCPITIDCAETLNESYVEGIAAPEYEEGAMKILEKKKDLRVILYSNIDRIPKFIGDNMERSYNLKHLPSGRIIIQKSHLTSIKGIEDLVLDPMIESVLVERRPSERELEDMLTAWYVNFGVRSNGIVFVKDGLTLAIGAGQQERVGTVEQAIVKAYQKEMDRKGIKYDSLRGIYDGELLVNPLEGAVCSSDGFFPFSDSIELLARVGVSAVIQPGGSIRDKEVIEAINKHNMAMAFTLERCFAHF